MDMTIGAYVFFGSTLVLTFGGIIYYYFTRARKTDVEKPKFKMLDDEN